MASENTAVERAIRRLLCAPSDECLGVGVVSIVRSDSPSEVCYHRPARASGLFFEMANIKQQKKRVGIQERQRTENLRYRSTIKTLTKRLESAVSDGDAERASAEHRELVRTIDRAATRGALHANTAARKKSRAARLVAASGSS